MIDWTDKTALSRFLKGAGITVEELARISGTSRAQLYRLVNGSFYASMKTQIAVNAALHQILASRAVAA